jgi:hypothetical protein
MTRKPLPRTFVTTVALAPVLAVALAGCNSGDASNASDSPKPGHHHSHKPTHSATSTPTGPTAPSSSAPTAVSGTKAYAVYYVGDGGSGPVLYREFHAGPALPATDPAGGGSDLLTVALRDAMQTTPLDPDYRSPWQGRATLGSAVFSSTGDSDTLRVDVSGKALAKLPAGMTAPEARAAVQQLVYTAQGAAGNRTPVTFTVNGKTASTLLGVDVSNGVAAGKVLTTLSTMSISNPNEGAQVSGDTLKVSGANNGFEGTVDLRLMQGRKVVAEQPGIGGFMGNRLYPWTITLNVSKVPAGTYQLVARNDDPSGGEGGEAAMDTRTVVIS